MRYLGIIGLMIGLSCMSGCRAGRIGKPTQNPWQHEWLLIHMNGEDNHGHAIQQNLLLGLAPMTDGQTLAISFFSETIPGEGTFRHCVSQSEQSLAPRKRSLAFESPLDSTGKGIRFYLSDKFLWIGISGGTGNKIEPVNIRLKITDGQWSGEEAEGVTGCRFWHADARDKARSFGKGKIVQVSMLGIESLDTMLMMAGKGSLVWLNAWDTENPGALFLQQIGDSLSPLGGFGEISGQLHGPWRADSTWRSKVLPVDYPVEFLLRPELEVVAQPVDQELLLGKRSFWMGGVTLTNPGTKRAATGNMVIFHPIRN